MSEERSCEEAFDAWWMAKGGSRPSPDNSDRSPFTAGFRAGWAARTPTLPAGELRDAIAKVVFDAILDMYPETMTVCARKAADALFASEQFTIGLRAEESVTFDGEDPDDAARWLLASDDEADAHLAFNDWFNTSDVPLRGTPNSLAAAFVAGAGWESHR